MRDPVGNPHFGERGEHFATAAMVPHGKETDAQKAERYGAALDQILARPSYPVALKIAQEARHPTLEEKT